MQKIPLEIVIPIYNEGEKIVKLLNKFEEEINTKIRVLLCYDLDEDNVFNYENQLKKYSFEVIRRISELHEFDLPLLLGPSRKSFLAEVSNGRSLNFSERDFPCALVSSIALWQGVSFLRFHEVEQGRLLIDTFEALKNSATK